MNIVSPKWAARMLGIAHQIASWSKDRSTKVGAIITTEDGSPVSWGFNGMPMGINDNIESRHQRPEKYSWMCHAERNAMDLAPRPLDNCVMFVTFSPCSSCCQSIIQRKIKTVVIDQAYTADKMPDRWQTDMKTGIEMLREAGVKILELESNKKLD
jgi:dCMP deaminase